MRRHALAAGARRPPPLVEPRAVLRHLRALRLARAVANELESHGHFAIVNWHAQPREETTILGEPRGPATELRMTPEATRAAVEPAGFRTARVVELPPYHYGAIFEKA